MDHLSILDAGFLQAEDSDRHVSLAIGGLAVLEGPMPESEQLVEQLSERLAKIPRFRQVLRMRPLDLGAPDWVDAEHLDLTRHVRRAALVAPGDDAALYRLVADLMERRLDRDRPLWECWLIEGLADGRWAIVIKIHHCMADGIATTQLLGGLSDGGAGDTFADEIRAAGQSPPDHRWPRLSLNPVDWVGGMWHTSAAATSAAVRILEGAVEVAAGIAHPTPPSSLHGRVSSMRRYTATSVPLDEVAKVRRAFDVTINDVALAAITDSYRAALIRRGEQPRRDSLRTLVPVSVRSTAAMDKIDNRVSAMLPYLPVEESDPIQQLCKVHWRMERAKRSGQRQATSMFFSLADSVPFTLTAWAMRTLTRLPQRGVVTYATNVPGPRSRLRIAGRRVLRLMPVPPIALQLRTGIAMLSYADDLYFGITADYDAAPDVDALAEGIERAVARLVELSGARAAEGR